MVQSLKTGQRKTLVERGIDASYVPTGHLVYVVGGSLFAVRFDPSTLIASGGPVSIVDGVRRSAGVRARADRSHTSIYKRGFR